MVQLDNSRQQDTSVDVYLNHLLSALNSILAHSHDTAFHGESAWDVEGWAEMRVFQKASEFWAFDFFEGLIASGQPFSKKFLKSCGVKIGFL